ncbi:hypothetical protein TL16_g06101 [Triparma laevis f. inornata]|uniref:3-hydroxyisobutyrate dehydrogenase n=2 Tax=Triparma laevis TaxID=1534972 RepID=A0A9W6ZT48_9STRA|nr:hypothetical protein TrLO_g15239 [Triparma laevis f. longispina]GMH73133.1 hypothetical protein TL16_g06101 [Triparma laevis f. inornata]
MLSRNLHKLTRPLSTSTRAAHSVGFIGLGNMGAYMASNLLSSGVSVKAFDLNPEAVNDLKQKGATVADSVESMTDCETIITMLPSSPHVQATVTTLLNAGWEGKTWIDSSTIDPIVSKNLGEALAKEGKGKIDAPVSGGVKGAAAGTLTFMVGGESSTLDAVKPYLETMGANIVHCGANGSGQTAKLCNNLAMAIQMVGTAEALNMGDSLGLDPKILAGIMNTSTSRCWSSDSYNPYPGVLEGVPAGNDYEGGFGSSLMLKDLGLATSAAGAVKSATPLGNATKEIYTMMESMDMGKKDFGAVLQFLKGNCGNKKC